jgi:hypothetical protein
MAEVETIDGVPKAGSEKTPPLGTTGCGLKFSGARGQPLTRGREADETKTMTVTLPHHAFKGGFGENTPFRGRGRGRASVRVT